MSVLLAWMRRRHGAFACLDRDADADFNTRLDAGSGVPK